MVHDPDGCQTILVVDDTPANLEVVMGLLSSEGYTVYAAASGQRALKQLQIGRPDLILLDIQMPGMDGLETCQKIKANVDTASIPIIFITAFSDAEKISQGFSIGAVDYITKPFQEAELLARVRTHLQLYSFSQSLEQRVLARTAELKNLEARQRRLFETSPIGLALCRMDGSLIDVNVAYAAIIGHTINETLKLNYWKLTPEAYMADAMLQLEQLEKTGRYGPCEKEYLHKDGHLVSVRLSGIIINQNGENFIWSSVEDISDRKVYEKRLETTNLELIRASRMKDEFLATMSHELRTPLNSILGMTEGLQEEIFGTINASQLKALNTIERSSEHLLRLINDILDLSRMAADKVDLTLEPTAIAPICYASIEMVHYQAQQKGIQIQTTIPPGLPLFILDDQRIRQVLINLLNNAVKFTPEGGQVSLIICPQSVPPVGYSSPAFLQITVNDTGIGIAPDNMDDLFQPFVQIDSALNRQYEGAGLGLALVKQIVELHHGQVMVKSKVGVGSSFIVNLPWLTPGTAV